VSFLIDTNVLSEGMKPRPDPVVETWLARLDEGVAFVSVVTFAELRYGVERMPTGRRRTQLEDWLSVALPARFDGRVLPIDEAVAAVWGSVMARGDKLGRRFGIMDAFIAATAEVHRLTLVTRNTRDFESLVGSIVNPWGRR